MHVPVEILKSLILKIKKKRKLPIKEKRKGNLTNVQHTLRQVVMDQFRSG